MKRVCRTRGDAPRCIYNALIIFNYTERAATFQGEIVRRYFSRDATRQKKKNEQKQEEAKYSENEYSREHAHAGGRKR